MGELSLFIVFLSLCSGFIIAPEPESVYFLAIAGGLFLLTGIFTILVVIGATRLVRQKGMEHERQ